MGAFRDLEQFVATHHPCGELTSEVGDLTAEGYPVRIACACGAVLERRVTPEMAPASNTVGVPGAVAEDMRRSPAND